MAHPRFSSVSSHFQFSAQYRFDKCEIVTILKSAFGIRLLPIYGCRWCQSLTAAKLVTFRSLGPGSAPQSTNRQPTSDWRPISGIMRAVPVCQRLPQSRPYGPEDTSDQTHSLRGENQSLSVDSPSDQNPSTLGVYHHTR